MVEYRIAEVAQLAERLYRKQQVAGPIPAFGSTSKHPILVPRGIVSGQKIRPRLPVDI